MPGIRLAVVLQLGLFVAAATALLFVFDGRGQLGGASNLVLSTLAFLGLTSGLFIALMGRPFFRTSTLLAIQLVVAQGGWTVLVLLSGGAASAATSLYGVTILVGGYFLAVPGVSIAALSAFVFYALTVLLIDAQAIRIPIESFRESYALATDESTYYLVTNSLVLLLVALLSAYLVERLQQTGGQLREAENRAAEAERLALLGRLASGLAHEIRNPLSSIAASVQLLRGDLAGENLELCDIVLREAGRLDDLVSDMTNLSKPRTPVLAQVSLNALVHDVVLLAGKSGRSVSDVRVVESLPATDCFVLADPSMLRQLLWNLVRNAVQASAAGEEVRVAVRTGERGLELSVSDHGSGIPDSIREHLFDAFYTTRSQGTGLGLAVVKKIAGEHGFVVDVRSAEGEGAEFVVILAPESKPGSSVPPPP